MPTKHLIMYEKCIKGHADHKRAADQAFLLLLESYVVDFFYC